MDANTSIPSSALLFPEPFVWTITVTMPGVAASGGPGLRSSLRPSSHRDGARHARKQLPGHLPRRSYLPTETQVQDPASLPPDHVLDTAK